MPEGGKFKTTINKMYLPLPSTSTDLRPNAFSAGAGNAVSAQLISEFDFLPRNEWHQLFLRHGEAPNFKTILMAMGFGLPNNNIGYGHFELPWHRNNLQVGAVVTAAGGAGQAHVVSIHASDHFQTQQFSGATQLYGTLPIKGQIWELQSTSSNHGVQVYIEEKDTTTVPSAHRLTLRPVDGTVNLNGIVGANAILSRITNAHGEGTGLPQGEFVRTIRYQNSTQIIKTSLTETGTSMTVQTMFGPENTSYQVAVAAPHMKRRHIEDASGALLKGKPNTNTALKATIANQGYDAPIKMTEGFIPSLQQYAQNDTFTSGSFAIDDFYDLSALLIQQRGNSHEYVTFEGHKISSQTERVLNDVFKYDLVDALAKSAFENPYIDYSAKTEYFKPGDFVASFGYRATKAGGCQFLFMTLPEFTSPVGFGASTSPEPEWRLVAPIDLSARDEQGRTIPSFGYRYASMAGFSRELMIGTIVGAGSTNNPIVSNEFDQRRAFMISEIGFQIIAANQFGMQRPA